MAEPTFAKRSWFLPAFISVSFSVATGYIDTFNPNMCVNIDTFSIVYSKISFLKPEVGFLQHRFYMFCLDLSPHARSRTPLPEKLPVIEASQSSLNQSSEAGEESDHEENPPPSYHDVILQDTQMDGDGLKYENCSLCNLSHRMDPSLASSV